MKVVETQRVYHVPQKEAPNKLLQNMQGLVDDTLEFSSSRDIQKVS
jgi:hypothetical protein